MIQHRSHHMAFLNTLLLLSTLTLCIYQLQQRSNSALLPEPSPVLVNKEDNCSDKDEDVSIYITMAVCFGSNTHYHSKQDFPYTFAAMLSTQLWHNVTRNRVQVIMQIVHHSEDVESGELLMYKRNLENMGAKVVLVNHGDMECVLKAQLTRLLAFQFDEIRDNDIIVTADVDAFVMTPDLIRPLLERPETQIWIYRYELTRMNGFTFMMPFIGARKSVWRDKLLWEYKGSLEALVDLYGTRMKFNKDYTWDVDQHILSYAILNSGLCSLNRDNKLWAELNLKPKVFDDSGSCWHGSGIYEDCNNKLWSRNLMIRWQASQCQWWHFYPDERRKQLQEKFDEIINNEGEQSLMGSFVQMAKNVGRDINSIVKETRREEELSKL